MQHALKNNQLTFGSAIKVYILLHLSHLFQMQISNTSKGVIMTVLVININFVSVCLAAHYLLENTCDLFFYLFDTRRFFLIILRWNIIFCPHGTTSFFSLSRSILYIFILCVSITLRSVPLHVDSSSFSDTS